jgi:hypothetical protein
MFCKTSIAAQASGESEKLYKLYQTLDFILSFIFTSQIDYLG